MVFGSNTGNGAGLAPMMAIWGNIKSPFFTGEVGAWADFEGEWKRYIRMLEDGVGKIIGADMKLEIFSNCLDPDNRQILQAKRTQGQKFEEIWEDFERRYVRDSIKHHRNHWRNLILPVDGLNEDHVRWFRSEWEKRKGRVEDATVEEEYELLLQRIGGINAKRIMFEEVKRGRGKFVLKMARLGDFTKFSVEKLVQRVTGDPPSELFEDQGWFIITVQEKEAERKLLTLKGKKSRVDTSLKFCSQDIKCAQATFLIGCLTQPGWRKGRVT
jgi:hypothetical protein